MSDFETIYREYSPGIYRFLYKLCGNAQLCEELTQECFYQAYISFFRYDGSCAIFTWLAAIAKNTYFKHLRSHKNEAVDYELLADELRDGSELPEDAAERAELTAAVRSAIGRLKPKQRDVVLLRIYAELPFSQIGRNLGITENSAKVIFFRAKREMEEYLSDEYGM